MSEKILGIYKHYKGKKYEVIGIASHSETLEEFVVYKPLYPTEHSLWIRPKTMFFEMVEINGKKIKRFQKFVNEQ
ncbi:MAG: DUF1653 domain-containing protein [Flavobacteriales bacterium]|nr:DUF1653 domain-containing protein [Flavobacteriales bacterium]